MFELIFFYLLLGVGLINFIHIGMYLVGANLYDMWQFKRAPIVKKHKRRIQPLVSIVVPAHNEKLVIERCLESIRQGSYRKVEVFVHNDMSTDSTRQVVMAYKKKYPKFNLKLVNRRHHVGKAGGVNYCIKRYAKGDFVMTLDADCILRKDAIKNAVSYFDDDPHVVGVAANVRLMDKASVLGVLQKFEHMIGYRSKKFYTMTNCEFVVGGVASTYRREIIKQVKYYDTDTMTEDIGLSLKVAALGNREHRIVYGVNVVAMTEGVHSFRDLLKQRYRWKMGCLQNLVKQRNLLWRTDDIYSRSLTWYRLPMAFFGEMLLLLQPFILSYVIFISIHYHTFSLVLGAYTTITTYALATVLFDEHGTKKHKAMMSLYVPFLYLIFFIMDTVQIVAIIRCLMHPNSIARKKLQHTWVSPERAGQQVQFS